MTRLSLRAFDPILVALVRGAGAGAAALIYLLLSRGRIPGRRQLVRLGSAAVGMVVLFPTLVSIALKYVPATHASVLGSILPRATAVFGVIRGRESVSRGFWIFAILGTGLICLFSAYRSGFHSIEQADVLLVAAFIACSYGYAEGGLLAREMGGWLVIRWAGKSVPVRVDRADRLHFSFWRPNRVSTRAGVGRFVLPNRGQPVHRFSSITRALHWGYREDEPGAIAFAVPGDFRRSLGSGRTNRGVSYRWDPCHHDDCRCRSCEPAAWST